MGFPSMGFEGSYRNSVEEVVKFFDTRHAGQYMIYNLCSERTYNYEMFHNR
jgi:phosphatidylinositol-3,4,5-trisphosphate 3-phosphatase/dual-specificity protein phosphatase PTEN